MSQTQTNPRDLLEKTAIYTKPTANRSPYIFTLVQNVKRRVYQIHVFLSEQYFAKTLQIISFKNDVYFLHGRVREKVPSFQKVTLFLRYKP